MARRSMLDGIRLRASRHLRGGTVVAAGMIGVLILGITRLGEKNLWLDEVTSWQFSGRFLQRMPDVPDVNMTLYYWLLAIYREFVTSDSEAALRALSVVFAALTIPVAYLLVRRLIDRPTAMVAVVLLAVDTILIRYSQEVRGYSLLVLLAVASTYLFVRAWDRGGWLNWLIYGVVAALALYNHFFAGFVIAAHGLSFLAVERRRAFSFGPTLGYSVFGLGAVPLVFAIAVRGGCQIDWIRPSSFDLLVTETREIGGTAGLVALAMYLFASGAAIIAAARSNDARRRRAVLVLTLWAVVPIVGALAISTVQPVFVLRYLVVALPALVVLAAAGISRLRPRPAAASAVALFVAVNLVGVNTWYDRPNEEEWEAAVTHVVANSEPADGVIYHTRSGRKPFMYYAQRLDAVDRLPIEVWTPKEPCGNEDPTLFEEQVASIGDQTRTNHDRVWLVLTHTEPWDPGPELASLLAQMDAGYELLSQATFAHELQSGHAVEVRLYGRERERVARGGDDQP